jgi:hypothetical protein
MKTDCLFVCLLLDDLPPGKGEPGPYTHLAPRGQPTLLKERTGGLTGGAGGSSAL